LRIFLLYLLLTLETMSFDVDTASKIFNKIFTAIFSQTSIHVYSPNDEYADVVHKAKNLILTPSSIQADITLLTSTQELSTNQNQLAFTTDLTVLREGESVIGAFYWEYGHPKIVFIRKRLDHYNIILDKRFEKYIVEELP